MKKGFLRIFIFISLITILFIPKGVYALKFTVEKSVDTIKPGQDVTVYVKASDIGDNSIKAYKISLTYDSSKLDLKSKDGNGLSNVGSANPIVIENANGTLTDGSTLATLVFSAKASGDANLTLSSSNVKTITDDDIKAQDSSSMVKVAALSSDATLSSLKIPNATISPKFDKNVYEYTTTIQDITEITVNAVASDSNSKITISDNYKNLQKGANEIKINVTSEDGKSIKTYIIKVTLKMTPTDEELLKANALLKNLKVDGYKIEFDKNTKKYTLTVPYKTSKIKVLAEPENSKATATLEGNTSLKVGRNTLRVVVTSEDKENKETYTLIITRSKEEKKVVQTCPDTTSSREWILFSVCMFVTFTLGIVLGYFLCKKEILKKIFKHKKREEQIDEELSDTIEIVDSKDKKNLNNK